MNFGKRIQTSGAKFPRPAPRAVNSQYNTAPFRRRINRIIRRIAESRRQTHRKDLKTYEPLLLAGALQLLRGGLGRTHG